MWPSIFIYLQPASANIIVLLHAIMSNFVPWMREWCKSLSSTVLSMRRIEMTIVDRGFDPKTEAPETSLSWREASEQQP